MSQRLFVGNLPVGIKADDLKQEFNAYGKVKDVDLKIKENLVDPDNPNVFAFITLDINRQMINQCISEFSQQQYHGRYLNVSIAKESFLDRLKREREEAAQKNSNKTEVTSTEAIEKTPIEFLKNKTLPVIRKDVTSSSSASSDSDSESETNIHSEEKNENNSMNKKKLIINETKKSQIINDETQEEDSLFIAKKKASTSLQNGRIKIEQIRNEPIHVISKKSKDIKQLDEKARISDLKRKESLNKMKNQYNQQKLAIKTALSSVDASKPKRVVFEDENEEEVIEQSKRKKIDLFHDEENNEEEEIENYKKDFEIKNQYEGKSGEKLIKLQSKFKLDPRFQMNEKFLDNEDDNDDKDSSMTIRSSNNKAELMKVDDENDERLWQIRIIEQVVGRKLNTLSDPHRKKLHKTMLRYDPTKQEDQKFLKNVQKIAKGINEGNHQYEPNIAKEDRPEPEVSKEQFYTINEDLTKSLKRRGDGFSLLSLFGHNPDDSEQMTDLKKNINDEAKSLLIPKSSNHNIDNPFKFDSSDSESEDLNFDEQNKSIVKNNVKVDTDAVKMTGGKTTKIGVWNENFFIFENDKRLKDGFEFFKEPKKDDNEPKEDYEKVRDKLRLIIKRKIVKSRKNLKNKKLVKGKFRRKK